MDSPRNCSWLLLVSAAILLFIAPHSVHAEQPKPAPTYWQDVQPVLRKNCAYCHAARHIKKIDVSGGLVLDTFEAISKGGERPVLKIGDSKKSLLVERLVTKNVIKRMPLDGDPLPSEKIELIRRWIDSGAKEGKRPAEIADPVVIAKSAKRRKLNVALATKAVPPAGLLAKTAPGPLTLNLKVGPLAPITAVAFSPDGKLLATGFYGQVNIWDLHNVRLVQTLTNLLGAVNDLAFSPDGKLLAVAGGQPSAKGDLRIFEVSDWQLVAAFRDHSDVVFSVAFSPDGKHLAAASFDHTVSLWRMSDFQQEKLFPGHSDFVYAVAFHPGGEVIASVSKDRTVRLTDIASGKSLFTLGGMEEDVMAVTFDKDGKQVISSGFETALYWWNAETGEKTRTQRGHGIAVHELTLSNDGQWLVSAAADRTVRIWNGGSGALIRTINVGSPVYCVAISPDKKWIASGSFDGLVRLWNPADGQELITLLALPVDEEKADWLALTPEGFLAANSNLSKIGQWTMRGGGVSAAPVWQALSQPDNLSAALQGAKLPAPKFSK